MKTSLCLLLLLLSLSQAQPLVEEGSGADVLEDNDDMDISNVADVLEDSDDVDISTVADVLEGDDDEDDDDEDDDDEDDDIDISTRILTSNNGSSETLLEGDLVLPQTRNAIKCWRNNCLWGKSTNGLVMIPYTLSSAFTSREKSTLERGLKSFHQRTCIRFVPRRNERDYISVESRGGCFSNLGKTGGRQVLSIKKQGCMSHGTIQHEANHALGIQHEQTRSDRDNHIRINWQNIQQRMAYNFKRADTNNLNTPYDYSSIMHYGRTAFSIQYGKDSMTPIPNPNVQIGQRRGMSRYDILRINRLYRC